MGGVTFRYDNQSIPSDFASVDKLGIYGTTAGLLGFDFVSPVISLTFDFRIGEVYGPATDGLFISFMRGGVEVSNMLVEASNYVPYVLSQPTLGGDALGSLAYNGSAFDQVQMYFSTDGPYFDVANIVYELEPLPQLAIAKASGRDDDDQQILMLTATGPSGSVSEIQSTTNLISPNWTTLVVVSSFTGSYTTYVTNNLSDAPQACFYRTLKTP